VGPLLAGQPASGARWATIPGIKGAGLPGRWDTSGAAQFLAFAPTSSGGASSFTLYAILSPLSTPSVVSTSLSVPLYFPPGRPEQPGTTQTAEIFGARLWSATFRGGSLWTTHHVTDPATGRTVVRWYEIAMGAWPASGQPVLRQWGQIDSGGDLYTYCPSIGVDAQGNVAVSYVRSGPEDYITICRALRRAGDTPGALREPAVVRASTASFTVLERWGDYSTTQADPAESCTFWGHHMWTTSASDWRTWVGRYENRPLADLNRDCTLNVLDFNAMLNLFAAGDPRADVDGSGALNVLDFNAFINAFGLGN
jgi:hypothetical protein